MAAVKLLSAPPGDELRALASICHPAVVGLLGGGARPSPYLAMELAVGEPLSQVEGLTLDEARDLVAALADALATMHAERLFHGDIKDANVVVRRGAPLSLKLVDFGAVGQAGVGTYAYAAPERLQGAPPSAAADIYALGVLFFRVVFGELPTAMGSLVPGQMASAPPWLAELLPRMMAESPGSRPTADAVVDALVEVGAIVPTPAADLIARRALHVHVDRPGDRAVEAAVEARGVTVVVGARGSGRTHTLRRVANEAAARGRDVAWLTGDDRAWSAVARLFADRRLGPPRQLPSADDPIDRAYQAAALLSERAAGAVLLVDDLERVDAASRGVVRRLAAEPSVTLVVASTEAPDWADHADIHRLGPWDRGAVATLVQQLLGRGVLEPYVDDCAAFAGGLPGAAVAHVHASVAAGALAWRARQWLHCPERVGDVVVASSGPGVDAASLAVATAMAVLDRPSTIETVALVAERSVGSVRRDVATLAALGLTRVHGERIGLASGFVRRRILDASEASARVGVHARVLRWLSSQRATEPDRMAWHAVGAGDLAVARHHGPAGVAAALQLDAADAARLSDALWELGVRGSRLAALRVRSLTAAGRVEEALAFGSERRAAWAVRVAVAEAHAGLEDHAQVLKVLRGPEAPLEARALQASAHFRLGEHEVALELATAALEAAGPPTSEAALSLEVTRAQTLAALGDRVGAIAQLRAVPRARTASTRGLALLDACLGRLLWHEGDLEAAGEVMLRASRHGGGLGTLDRARLANNAANASFQLSEVERAVARWERARLLFQRVEARESLVAVHLNLCAGYRELGRWARARRCGLAALDDARALGHQEYVAMAAGNLGDVYLDTAKGPRGRELLEEALECARQAGAASERVETTRRLAELRALERSSSLAAAAAEARRCAAAEGQVAEEAWAMALEGLAVARDGSPEAGVARVEAAAARVATAPAPRALAEVRVLQSEVLWLAGREAEARAVLTMASFYAEEVQSSPLRARLNRVQQGWNRDGETGRDGGELLDALVALAGADQEQEAIRIALEAAVHVAGAACAWILEVDGHAITVVGERGEGEPVPAAVARRCARSRRSVVVADVRERGDLSLETTMQLDQLKVLVAISCDGLKGAGVVVVRGRQASPARLERHAGDLERLGGALASARRRIVDRAALEKQARQGRQVAHDLRNLAAALQHLATEPVPPRDAIDAISRSMVELADEHLTGASLLSNRVPLRPLLEHVLGLARHAERRGVRFLLADHADTRVHVPAALLQRAVFNLVSNASRHSPPDGTVVVTIEQSDRHAFIRVRDHGEGVDMAAAPRGYGIGLEIAADVAASVDGGFDLTNHPQGGAVATLTLPLSSHGRDHDDD